MDVEWIRFLLFSFRQDYQDHQDFFACGERLSAEGRIIHTIRLILSNYFF
jgi:hypothetical protein